MRLPKLYRPIEVSFMSLRNGIGEGGGVIFDIDRMVTRQCMRVATPEGWKWQICDYRNLLEWDYYTETDQESLNEQGMEIDQFIKFEIPEQTQ